MTSDRFRSRRSAMIASGLWKDRVLLDYFDVHVRTTPTATAIVAHEVATDTQTRLTYGELADRTDQIAAGLLERGIARGDIVACQLPGWWQFIALHLACLRIGAVTNPIMPIMRRRELEFMLNLTQAKLIVTPAVFRGFDYPAMIAGLRGSVPGLAHALVVGGTSEDAFERLHAKPLTEIARGKLREMRPPTPDDVIEVVFTSGTTGEPKGVMHSSNTLISATWPFVDRLDLTPADIVFMASPLAHQTGFVYGMMIPLILGSRVVLQDIWDPAIAARLIASEQATFTMASTPFLADLTEEAVKRPQDFRSLRVFLSAGAPIPRVLVRRATDALRATIASGWGMTENGAVTVTKPGDPPEKAFETDGCPLPGMEIRTVDAGGLVLPPGAEGCLQVRSCSSFLGYLNRPELDATDADGWFETGDYARIDADGYVRITGRAKDIIIRGGENIPVVEIEGLAYKHPAIIDIAIVAMPDERLGERACAFVTLKPGNSLTLQDLTDFLLTEQISKSYLPEHLEVLDTLPRTASGKIQKFALRELAKTLQHARPSRIRK